MEHQMTETHSEEVDMALQRMKHGMLMGSDVIPALIGDGGVLKKREG